MRTLWAALLSAAALAALLGGWFATGWRSVSSEAAALVDAPRAEAARRAAVLAAELGARLEEMRAAEDGRPYYEYQNLYHDPRGASEGQSVVPSPLARGPSDALIAVHFQIAPDGRLTVPTINEEVPELSDPSRIARDRPLLAALRARAGELRPDAHALRAKADAPSQVQAIDPAAYAQNVSPNQVYRQVQQQKARPPALDPVSRGRVDVRVARLAWRTAEIEGPRLLAMRAVDTPDGTLTQGFAIAPEAVAGWLAQRAGRDLPAILVAGPGGDSGASAPLPLAGPMWHVAVDPSPALAAARDAGGELRRGFLWRFVPSAALAILCGALVVALVARADRLARERSEFAAAAAHELRTPLAGLALYGDMLADGLGDPERSADYARRVSDEAGRLGRVVGNVLGFSQLERRGLTVSPRAGDAAQAARDALERMRPALEHDGVALEADIPEAAPAGFDADALARILQNLLDNAEKYSRGAADRCLRISVRAESAGGATIEVADRGPGVAGQVRQRLFRPFARATGGPAGLGLGLALARAQARAMGGELTHREREGGGAVFSLRLPPASSASS
ncbi:MAG TPA: HAMP domain-containing sensor histidine kinase [Kofleriaceae bacterium]|nr:HAMP domain-containing sensor histidine kinase [Kofleriaceae bacterium]